MSTIVQNNSISSNTSAQNSISEIDVCNILIRDLAEVRGEAYSDLYSQFTSGGDMKTDSSEAEVIIVALEEHLGTKLPGPSKLRAEQFTSIKSLANIAIQNLKGQTSSLSAKTHTKSSV